MNVKFIKIVAFLMLFAFNSFGQDTLTILDVYSMNLGYFKTIDTIDANNGEIFNNSPEWQQKRHNRVIWQSIDKVNHNGSFVDCRTSYNTMVNKTRNNTSAGLTWEHIGPFEKDMVNVYGTAPLPVNIGQTKSLAKHPTNDDILYVGAALGGLWKTENINDNSPTWICITPNLMNVGVNSIAVDNTNPDIMYISTGVRMWDQITDFVGNYFYGEGVWKTIDGGGSWVQILPSTASEYKVYRDIQIDPIDHNKIMVIGDYHPNNNTSENYFYISNDGGQSFSQYSMYNNPNRPNYYHNFTYDPNNSDIIFASGNTDIAYSDDGGHTWISGNNNLPTSPIGESIKNSRIKFNFNDNSFYLFACGYDFNYKIYKWSGIEWEYQQDGSGASYVCSFNIANNGRLFTGSVYGYSYFGGNSYILDRGHADIRDILITDLTGEEIYLATDGGVVKNVWNGNGYTRINKSGNLSLFNTENISFPEDKSQEICFGSMDVGTWLNENGIWRHVGKYDGGATETSKINKDNKLSINGDGNNFYKYWNGIDLHHSPNFNEILVKGTPEHNTPVCAHPFYKDIIYANQWENDNTNPNLGIGRYLTKSTDDGKNFSVIGNFFSWFHVKEFIIHPTQPDNFLITTYDKWNDGISRLYISSDEGLNFGSAINLREIQLEGGGIEANTTVTSDLEYDQYDEDKFWLVLGRFEDGKKVYFTENGGQTFTNITYNLPNVLCHALEQDVNTGRLYLGTDWGIYYIEEGTEEWIKDDDFGVMDVSDIEIDYSRNVMVVSTYGNGLFEAELPCGSVSTPLEITSNTTWNGNMYINSDIIVRSGNTLTVKQSVFMPDSKKITVEPSAKLIVDGGTITNKCNGLWEGIYVYGDQNSSQYAWPATAGEVIVKNDATIENAKYAIKSDYGGIVTASNSNFVNNWVGIFINTWTNPSPNQELNKTTVTSCNFETNAELANGNNPYNMIYVNSNLGKIRIKACTFKNTRDLADTGYNRGTGINSYNSNLEVSYNCTVTIPIGGTCPDGNRIGNSFEDLNVGIYTSTYTAVPLKVESNSFENNYKAITVNGFNNTATIIKNAFDCQYDGDTYVGYNNTGVPYGVYLNGTRNYTIEENTFENGTGTGIYAYNSGDQAQEIYNNSFTGFGNSSSNAAATVALNKNSNYIYNNPGYLGDIGLEFRCNDYTNNNHALAVVDGNMRKDQGNNSTNTTELAGNTFDHYGLPLHNQQDFYVDATIYYTLKIPNYYYYQHTNNATYEDTQLAEYSGNVNAYTLGQSYDPNQACPSHLTVAPPPQTRSAGIGDIDTNYYEIVKSISEIQTNVETLDAEINTAENELQTLVDNGNTDILLSQTETANENNFAGVSNNISQTGGFISDKVATEYIKSDVEQDFVKASTLIQVSPLPQEAKTELDKSSMNETLKYIVSQYQNGINIREQKELIIANQKHARQMLIRDAIRYTLNDSLPEKLDSLILFMQTRENIDNRYTLTALQIKDKRFDDAQAELNNLNARKSDFPQEKQEEIETFINLQNIIINIEQNSDTMFNTIIDNNIDYLNQLATDSNSVFQSTVWGLLEQAEKASFNEITKLPETNLAPRNAYVEKLPIMYDKHNGLEPLINIYPNPASDYIKVEYAMLDKNDNITVNVIDMQGKVLKTVQSNNQIDVLTISVSDLPSGNYNVQFVSAKQGHYTVKINKK